MSLNTCYFSNFYQKYQLWDRVMFYLSLYPKCNFVTCSDFDPKQKSYFVQGSATFCPLARCGPRGDFIRISSLPEFSTSSG